MAISKIIGAIHPPKSGGCYKILGNVIDYILNPEKTVGGLYAGAINCTTATALQDFISTKEYYGKNSSSVKNRLAYHYVISFPPDAQINEDLAFKILKEFCEEYVGSEYEVVYSLHNDQQHLHGHICFNSVNFMTGYKFRYNDGDWSKKIQPLLDHICKNNGVNTLEMDTGVSIEEYERLRESEKKAIYYKRRKASEMSQNKKNTYYKEVNQKFSKSDFVRADIDELMLLSDNFEDFLKRLSSRGYDVKIGNSKNHVGGYLWLKNGDIRKRTYSLGADYEIEEIKRRIVSSSKQESYYHGDETYRFFIPVQILISKQQHTKIKEPAALKLYYAYLYRLGVKPRRKKSNYYEVKKLLSELESIERRLLLRDDNKIYSIDEAKKQISDTQQKLEALQSSSKLLKKEINRYMKVLERLENNSDNMENTENTDVKAYISKCKRELKSLNMEIKEEKVKLADLNKISEVMIDSVQEKERLSDDYKSFLDIIAENAEKKVKKIK